MGVPKKKHIEMQVMDRPHAVDLLMMKSFLLLLSIIGCCVGQDLLPEGPVEAVLRKNVTFKTLVELEDDFVTFVWSYERGNVLVPIVTLTPTGETVAEGYRGRVRVNRTNGFLTLGPLKASDRGYYSATMVTPEMKKTGETMLRVLGCCEFYALPEGPVDVVSGKNVTFRTLIDPKEEIIATAWVFSDGNKVFHIARESVVSEGYRGRVTLNETNGFLTLGPLTTTDSGDYYVNIFTAKGKEVKTGDIKLQVLEPVSDVTIRADESETVEFNSTVVLTCSAKGSFLKFSWTSGSAPITADDTRVTIKEDDTSSILTISGVQSSDLVGPIYCTAANQLEMEKSAPFNLTVVFPTTPSVLTTQPGIVRTAWSVTFENPDPCALKGSSVQFRCSYDYPDGLTVHKNEWSKGGLGDGIWKRIKLSSLPSYHNRVKYLGDKEHNCSLEIYDLKDNDTGYYYFKFDTNTYGWRSRRSVYLSVTDLTASVKPDRVREGRNVTLTCDMSCNLSDPATIVWFRNGQPVVKPLQFQAGAEDAGSYTCAVKGQESMQSDPVFLDVQYAPVNVSVEVSQSGSLAEGSSVNLTCSSAANPKAHSYTWYRRTASSSLLHVGSGQILSLSSLQLSDTGLYVCQARNHLGEKNSAEALLEVDISEGLKKEEKEGGNLRASHITTSPYTTLSSYTTTSQKDGDNQDYMDIQHTWFDKLQAELVEMRLSFERSLRQMESRTHSLLWSMSRRMERMTEAMDRNSASSHRAKTYVSIKRFPSAVTPSSQPGSRPTSPQTRNHRRRGGRGRSRS